MPAMRIWQAFLIAAAPGKVLKMDRPAAGGFLSLTALQAEGCGLPLCGNAYKVSVTGLAFWVRWHEKHYGNQPPPVAFPPLVPYGTKGGISNARRAVVWFYTNWRLLSIHRRPTTTLAPEARQT